MVLNVLRASIVLGILAYMTLPVVAAPVSSLMCSNPGSTTASASANFISADSCTDFSYLFPATQPASGLNNWQYGYYQGSLNPATFSLMSPTPLLDTNGNPIPGSSAGWWSQDFFQYWTALDAFGAHSNSQYTDYHSYPYCISGVSCNPAFGMSGGYDPRSPNGPDSGNFYSARRYIVPAGFTGDINISLETQKDPRTAFGAAQGYVDYVIDYSGGVATILGCINVPVNGTMSSNVVPANCSNAFSVTADPLGTSQPIYATVLGATVKPGDKLDFVVVPNFDTLIPFSANASGTADFGSGSFQLIDISGPASPIFVIPEPSSIGLVLGGLGLLAFVRRRLTV